VRWYREYLDERQAIVFCASVEQSRRIEREFRAEGITCCHADAKTKPDEREKIMRSFRKGHTKVLTNVQLVDEGFDVPECEGVIIARPTRSLVFHRQSCGRALRPKRSGGKAIIIDMAGNASRCGLPSEPLSWTLEGKQSRDSLPPIRTCPECFAVVPAATKVCLCGYVFKVEPKSRTPKQIDGVLERLTPGTRDHTQRQREIYEALVDQAERKGWKIIAARVKFKATTGIWLSKWTSWAGAVDTRVKRSCTHVRVDDGVCRFCERRVPVQGTLNLNW
jgi:superfamily II DNA or RNA helicase